MNLDDVRALDAGELDALATIRHRACGRVLGHTYRGSTGDLIWLGADRPNQAWGALADEVGVVFRGLPRGGLTILESDGVPTGKERVDASCRSCGVVAIPAEVLRRARRGSLTVPLDL